MLKYMLGFFDLKKMLIYLSVILCYLSILAMPSLAQTFRGSVLGNITDQSGLGLPGVAITIKNVSTGVTRTASSDDSGAYVFRELPIGLYELVAERDGFQTATVPNILVEIAGERRVDVPLAVGKVEQAIVVTDTVPLVDSRGNTLGGNFQSSQVENLPINGRDFTKLLPITSGTNADPSDATDSPGSFGLFTANGNRGRANNYLLDGTDINDGYRNLPAINEAGVFGTPATILPVESISELAVLTNFAPEYGRNSGAIVNIVTKSGTNQLHGSIFEYIRNNVLDARNFFNTTPDPQTAFRNNQFGFSLGGPVIKSKAFFFIDYEGQRERVGLNGQARVPDPREIAALGGATNSIIAGVLARNPFPAPNRPVGLFDPSPNLNVTTRAKNDVDSLITKFDYNLSQRDLITGRYYYGNSNQSFPLALLGGSVLPGFNTVTPTRVQVISLSYLRIISGNKVNEARFGYNRFKQGFFAEDRSFNPNDIGLNTGVNNPRDFGLPVIRILGDPQLGNSLAPIGSNLSLPRGRIDTNIQALDNLSVKFAKHDVKFGVEFRRTFVNAFFDAGARGRLDFGSLSDFLAGKPSGGRISTGDSQRGTFQNSYGFFAQDSYRVTPNITINYGLRYDIFGVLGEERNRLSRFDSTQGLLQVGKNGVDKLYERDLNNFAPRVGIAWDLTGKGRTVVRAFWGLFYDSFSQDFFVGQLPFNTLNPGAAYNPIGESPILFSFSPTSKLVPGQPVFSNFTDSDAFSVDRKLRTPYIQNFNLNFQQQLGSKLLVQMAYVGSQSRKLLRYIDINQPTNPAASTSRPFDNGPRTPSGGTFFYVNQLESTAVSTYNSLQFVAILRDLAGVNINLNYTLSHSIDNASDGQDYVANAAQPDNSFRPDLEKGNSNFDSRHRLVITFDYRVPTLSKRFPRLTSGFSLSGVVSLRSGAPFHVNFFDDYNGTGEFFVRPDLVGDPYAGTHAPDRFLNLSAFAVPCGLNPKGSGGAGDCIPGTQHFGSLGRNSLIGPNFRNFDFSIAKQTNITEKIRLELRAEFYNIFNHPNFSSPLLPSFAVDAGFNGVNPVTGRGMGFLPITVTPDVGVGNPFLGGGSARNIQFAAKVSF